MNSEELSTKLLYPNDTSKARKVPKDSELKQKVNSEVCYFYKK